MIRFISSAGHGAPAMMPVRKEDRSRSAKPGVIELGDEHGGHAVQRRAALGLDHVIVASASKPAEAKTTMAAPWATQASVPSTMPKQ